MNNIGLALACRYSYPPNLLSLCGPKKQTDLKWYAITGKTDKGTAEILSQFATLYPYLCFIAYQNNINNPFSPLVVEAYWLGNSLLNNISKRKFGYHLKDTLNLKKKIKPAELSLVLSKLDSDALPHHSFHILNVYKRTGHLDILHTVETMDACLINWGKVVEIKGNNIFVKTQPLKLINDKLTFASDMIRTIIPQGVNDERFKKLKIGDTVSYHWGYFCQKLTAIQLRNLIYYTKLSLAVANLR